MKYTIENLDKVLWQLQKDSDSALMKCWQYLEKRLKEEVWKDSKDTGDLVRSITTVKVSDDEVDVWTRLFYWLVREYWRRPWKFPPLQALVGWTARKGMISWWKTARYEDLHYEDKGTIYVIARAIAQRGIEWKHTFERTLEKERENIKHLYVKYMNEW